MANFFFMFNHPFFFRGYILLVEDSTWNLGHVSILDLPAILKHSNRLAVNIPNLAMMDWPGDMEIWKKCLLNYGFQSYIMISKGTTFHSFNKWIIFIFPGIWWVPDFVETLIYHRIHVWNTYLHEWLKFIYGKCRQIYHTWSIGVTYLLGWKSVSQMHRNEGICGLHDNSKNVHFSLTHQMVHLFLSQQKKLQAKVWNWNLYFVVGIHRYTLKEKSSCKQFLC